MYDRKCTTCGILRIDVLEPVNAENPTCQCGGCLIRVFTQRAPTAIPDSIPGGIEIAHGLCNPDGTPRRYDSKSDILRECRVRGIEPMVRHVAPHPDSDRSPHTTRWDAPPAYLFQSDEDRRREWWAYEHRMGHPPPVETAPELGVGIVAEGGQDVKGLVQDAYLKIESSGFHEAQYRGVNNPLVGKTFRETVSH